MRSFRRGTTSAGRFMTLMPTFANAAIFSAAVPDESDDRLLDLLFHKFRRLLLVRAADLADHHDRCGVRVCLEGGEAVNEVGADEGVAADPDTRGLPHPMRRELVDDLVGQRAAARNDADLPRRADVAGDDADLALARRDQTRTVRSDQTRPPLVDERQDPRHVQHRNSFGNADDQTDAGVGGLENGGRRDRGRNVNDRRIGLGCVDRLGDGVEYRHGTLELLAAFPRRHTGDDAGAVLHHLFGVKRSVAARNSLHQKACGFIDEGAHPTACFTASSMSASALNPARARIAIPSFSLVPVSRITIGTLSGNSFVACTMPFATSSPRVMPPKMLNRMTFTRGSEVMIRSAATTFWGFELPPMSRKFAGSPP